MNKRVRKKGIIMQLVGTLSPLDLLLTSSLLPQAEPGESADTHPSDMLLRLVGGFWISCALYVAAKLRIADALKEEPRRSKDLAVLTDTHAPSLYRLLRALASTGIFAEDRQGYFTLTPPANYLRSDLPESFRSFVLQELKEAQHRSWEEMLYSVKTGRPARRVEWAEMSWRGMASSYGPDEVPGEPLDGVAARLRAAICRGYDFSRVRALVDLSGGDGTFLAFLLQSYAPLQGVVFTQPYALESAQARLKAEGVTERCKIIVGDFSETVPNGHELYLLREVLRNHDDARAMTILKNCRRAMPPQGKLLLIEAIVPEGNTPSFAKLQDLNLLLSSEGRERTEKEFNGLLRKAGLRLNRILPTTTEACILEVVRG